MTTGRFAQLVVSGRISVYLTWCVPLSSGVPLLSNVGKPLTPSVSLRKLGRPIMPWISTLTLLCGCARPPSLGMPPGAASAACTPKIASSAVASGPTIWVTVTLGGLALTTSRIFSATRVTDSVSNTVALTTWAASAPSCDSSGWSDAWAAASAGSLGVVARSATRRNGASAASAVPSVALTPSVT